MLQWWWHVDHISAVFPKSWQKWIVTPALLLLNTVSTPAIVSIACHPPTPWKAWLKHPLLLCSFPRFQITAENCRGGNRDSTCKCANKHADTKPGHMVWLLWYRRCICLYYRTIHYSSGIFSLTFVSEVSVDNHHLGLWDFPTICCANKQPSACSLDRESTDLSH